MPTYDYTHGDRACRVVRRFRFRKMRCYEIEYDDGTRAEIVEIVSRGRDGSPGTHIDMADFKIMLEATKAIETGNRKTIDMTDWTREEKRDWLLGKRH